MLPLRHPDLPDAPASVPLDRATLGALMSELEDLLGNRDGLWHNEETLPGTLPAAPARAPSVEAWRQARATGWSTDDEQATLDQLIALGAERWGQPATALSLDRLPNGAHHIAHKTLLLARLDRTPDTVRDTFVRAAGSVDGVRVPTREVRVQVFAPTTPPSGCAVVVIPGHATPISAALDRVVALNARGHAVVCMAHAWTAPPASGPARGLGLMRDVAAVIAATAAAWGPGRTAVHARSVGAGVGVLGALVHGARGAVELDDAHLPLRVPSLFEAAWPGGGWHRSDLPDVPLSTGAHRPDTAALVPDDPPLAARAAQLAVLANLRVPEGLLSRLETDLRGVLEHIADGVRPMGPLHLRATRRDPLADLHQVRALASALGASCDVVPGSAHLSVLDPSQTTAVVDCLDRWLTQPSAPAPAPTSGPHGAARDRSLRFTVLANRAREGADILPPDARDPVYLTVPGLFTERYPAYMADKFARMAALGLDHHMVPIDTDDDIAPNAAVVQQTVLEHTAAGRRAVLLGHSKGGVDIAAALAFYPELQPRVRAVVTLQAPWLGTPIADLVDDQAVLSWAHRFIVEGAFDGSVEALRSLRMDTRAAFVARHPWPAAVPAVSFASMLQSWRTLLAVPDALLTRDHGPTDGFVPVAYAIVPGSDAVIARDVDHAGPVLPRPIGRCAHLCPGDMTVALLALALEVSRVEPSARRQSPPR